MRPSPGSKRSITSPSATRSQRRPSLDGIFTDIPPSPRLLPEFGGQRLAVPRQEGGVVPNGHQRGAEIEPVARIGFDRRENASRFSGRANALDGDVYRRPHLGMGVV